MKILLLFSFLFLGISDFTEAQEQNKHYILLEKFTNTYCPPCIFRTPTFNEKILSEYEDIEVFQISYHVGHPVPDDVFYQANIEEIEERELYYQAFGTPMLFVSGESSPPGPSPDYEILPTTRLQEYLGSISPLEVIVRESIIGENQRKVNIEVKTVNQLIPSNHFKLRAVLVEKFIEYEPPFEGMETTHHNTFRQTLGGWEGINFTPAKVGESIEYEYTYDLKGNWREDQIYVLAFIQNDSNQSILNVGSSWQNEITNIGGETLESYLQIFPNPSSDFIQIRTAFSFQSVQVFDSKGQVLQQYVFNSTNATVDIHALPKGIYFISLQSENERTTRKIIKW